MASLNRSANYEILDQHLSLDDTWMKLRKIRGTQSRVDLHVFIKKKSIPNTHNMSFVHPNIHPSEQRVVAAIPISLVEARITEQHLQIQTLKKTVSVLRDEVTRLHAVIHKHITISHPAVDRRIESLAEHMTEKHREWETFHKASSVAHDQILQELHWRTLDLNTRLCVVEEMYRE